MGCCFCDYVSRKEGNVLFNDTVGTLNIQLFGTRYIFKDNSDNGNGNWLPPPGVLLFQLPARDLLYALFHRICDISCGALDEIRYSLISHLFNAKVMGFFRLSHISGKNLALLFQKPSLRLLLIILILVYKYMCLCVYVYICMCVCVYMCINVCVYMCKCVYVYVCICVYVFVCICVYMYVCMCVYVY